MTIGFDDRMTCARCGKRIFDSAYCVINRREVHNRCAIGGYTPKPLTEGPPFRIKRPRVGVVLDVDRFLARDDHQIPLDGVLQ